MTAGSPHGSPAGERGSALRSHAPRLDALTGLRWWAAYAVFLHHMGNLAPLPVREVLVHGNYGVAFFFVLSGFVLTWSARPGLPVTTFWWRRFARIWPAHVVALLLAVPVFYSSTPDSERWWVKPFDLGVLALSVVLLQGWWRDPLVLFSGNPAAWTLTCESFFYALHPALGRAFSAVTRRGVLLLLALVVVGAVLLRVVVVLRPESGVAGLPWPVLRLTEFVIGIGAARAVRLGWRPPVSPGACAGLLAAVLAGASRWPAAPVSRFANEAVIVLFGLLIAVVAARDAQGRASWLRRRWLVVLGEWSYAFYLVHATLIYAVLWLAGPRPEAWANLWWYLPLTVAGIAAAGALHVLVERPAERVLRDWWDDRRARSSTGPACPSLPGEP